MSGGGRGATPLCGLSGREWNSLSNTVQKKIENYLGKLAREHDDRIGKLEKDIRDTTGRLKIKLNESEAAFKSVDGQLHAANSLINEVKASSKALEAECDDLRKQRNLAIDERHRLQFDLQKRDNQIETLTSDVAELTDHLKRAIEGKCEALSKHDEIQNKASSLEQRERRMEQEKILLNNQIQNLTDDVNKYAAELQTVRSEYDLKIETLQSELTLKNEKIELAGRRLKDLTEVNNELLSEKNRLSGNAFSRAESENEALDHYKKEIDAKTKLIEMYLITLEENKIRINQLDNQLEHLKKSESTMRDEKNVYEIENQKLKEEFETSKITNEKIIQDLRSELTKITARLEASKEESLSLLLEDMSPAASATCNLIKKMSLTQIYGQIVKLSDELSETKKENDRLDRMVTILSDELKEEKEKIKEQCVQYTNIAQNNLDLKNENNELVSKFEKFENEKQELVKQSEQTASENARLKSEIKDLSRQICFLLNEMQDIKKKQGDETDGNNVNIPNSQIAKALITFKDIEELQSNNLSLIKLVNELKDKLKYPKIVTENVETNNIADLLNKRITDLIQAQDHQSKIIDALTAQRDRFEKLYNDSQKNELSNEAPIESVNVSVPTVTVTEGTELANLKTLLEKQREDHRKYKEEMQINESILKKQLDNTQKKLADLNTEYAKCSSECKMRVVMYESLKNSVETYKKQISGLEERNKIYDLSILKQDETIRYLRDQTMESLAKLSKSELALENLKHQCKFLQDSENRLKKERDLLKKERFSQSLIINDIELIKVSEQLKEGEERIGFETRLEATNKELIDVQRSLKLQEDKYNEMKSNFEKQLAQSENLLVESNSIIEKKKSEISHLNEQLQNKTKMIDDLNKRVLNLIAMSSQEDTPEVVRKVKDLENQLLICQSEIDALSIQLGESKEYGKEYYEKFTNIDAEYKKLDSSLIELKQNFEIKTQEMQNSEQVLKDKIAQLEMKLSFQSRDLNLLDSNELKMELSKTINLVESLTRDLEEKNNQLSEAKSQVLNLTQVAQKAEDKYAHEMILHSTDVQTLSNLKKQMSELKAENNKLIIIKKELEQDVLILKDENKLKIEELINDRERMLALLDDLRKQNTALHNQLQIYSSSGSVENLEGSSNSSENLFEVVKCLKKENDLMVTKYEMINAENKRLKSEINILNKNLHDVKITMESNNKNKKEDQQPENSKIDNEEHIEKLNVLTDSNVLLRQERDSLLKKVSQLTETTASYESMIKIVQNTNDELKTKFDLLQTENANLKTEITRWRSRVGSLVEKANKQSPEDWKRLQNERETLAKKLTVEKENAKKLLDEISVLRTAKSDIEEQINTFNLKFTSLTNEYNKQSNELTIVKNDVSRITQELLEAKTSLEKERESNKQLNEKLAQNETSLAEVTKREGQLRKIANKYKLQYNELLKTAEEQKSASTSKEANTITDEKIIDQLKEQVSNSSDKCTNFEKEIVSLRENLSNFEQVKQELLDSKSSINQLTEVNQQLSKELDDIKASVELSQKSNLEMETRLAEIKSRYDEQIMQSERHHALQERLKNSEIVQLNRKIEYLMNKIKGGLATQTPKPSTSFSQESATISEIVKVQTLAAIAGTSDISSSPSSSQNITENLPSSSSAASHSIMPQFHKSGILPPESTQDVESNVNRDDESPKQSISTASPRMDSSFKTIKEIVQSHQAASSSSNNSNSNSTVTTSHGNDNSETSQRIGKRLRLSADQTSEETTGKRLKIQMTESELEYQVPTSSQRDQEDDCVILLDSGDEDNQCGNSYQEISEDMEEDEEEKIVESAQHDENQSADTVEKVSVLSAAVESNEVDVDIQPSPNPLVQPQREENVPNSNEANTDDSPPGISLSNEQQIETISSVTEGGEGGNGYLSLGVGVGSAGVSGTYDDGSDSIVPSTPVLYLPRRNDDFGEAINSPATESTSTREGCFTFAENRTESNDGAIEDTHADLTPQIAPHLPGTPDDSKESSEADAESFQLDEDSSLVSSQGSHSMTLQQLEEGSEAEASSSNASNSRRGQGQRPQSSNNRTSDYQLRQPQRYRNGRPIRRPYRR